jgi:hypothetical protein
MAYLGDKGRSEAMRFWLVLDAAPTGTPTITITRGQGIALDTPISAVNMTQGADTLEWYYDYTTEAAAQVGKYTAKGIAVIGGVTRYAYDFYDVTINDADVIDAVVDAILVDTGTTLPALISGLPVVSGIRSLGEKGRDESFRIYLTIRGSAPTGTPQIWIEGPLYLTDLATDGAGTGVSSTTGGFEAGMVDSYLYISTGIGFTPGSYQITAVADTNNMTIGSSAGANASFGVGIINNKTILAAANMIQGADSSVWYYDYQVASDAQVGSYIILRSAVIDGDTYYAIDNYDVSINIVSTEGDSDAIYD